LHGKHASPPGSSARRTPSDSTMRLDVMSRLSASGMSMLSEAWSQRDWAVSAVLPPMYVRHDVLPLFGRQPSTGYHHDDGLPSSCAVMSRVALEDCSTVSTSAPVVARKPPSMRLPAFTGARTATLHISPPVVFVTDVWKK